jgi:hypothetical protein
VTVAAAVGTAGSAQAQTPANPLRYSPDGTMKPTAYSQVVEVNGPHRIIFIAGTLHRRSQTASPIAEIAPGTCSGRHTDPSVESTYVMEDEQVLKVNRKPTKC